MRKDRIESLDHLRGLMALSVMSYHYASWTFGALPSSALLGRLGIYAVSIFYVLSGLSLSLVYSGRVHGLRDVTGFVVKRVFRIFPLFYLVVTLSLLLMWLSSVRHGVAFAVPWRTVALNYTLLFGFVDPTAYLSTGAWSIGNEMVFYAIFPFLLLLTSRWRLVLPLVWLIAVAVEVYFAYVLLTPSRSLEAQWPLYINPFNQFFLFVSGVVVGCYLRPSEEQPRRWVAAAVAMAALMVFSLWPSQPNSATIATGSARLILSAACVTFVACVFVGNESLRGRAARMLAFLGEGCYSIYLLHPLVAVPFVLIAAKAGLGVGFAYCLAFVATLVLSGLTFRYLESPLIRIGKRVSARESRALPVAS